MEKQSFNRTSAGHFFIFKSSLRIMLFKITRATDSAETTEETREAENRQQIEADTIAENPGFEWTSSDTDDHLIGKKYRADGSGTEQIVIVKPIIIAVIIAVIWWFLK